MGVYVSYIARDGMGRALGARWRWGVFTLYCLRCCNDMWHCLLHQLGCFVLLIEGIYIQQIRLSYIHLMAIKPVFNCILLCINRGYALSIHCLVYTLCLVSAISQPL